jgi:hypothetical protein
MSHEDEGLILAALEPAQRTGSRVPLPRRRLGRGTLVLLWVLRIYVLFAVPLVIYTFVRTLVP